MRTLTPLLEDQIIERLLGTGGAAAVVGDDQFNLVAENTTGRVDLLDGKLGRLDDRWRDHAVGPAEAGRHADLDRVGGCPGGRQRECRTNQTGGTSEVQTHRHIYAPCAIG
jgi:hypothetical protein